MAKIELGIAPIGWTNDDMPDLGSEISFEQCISEMSEAGFKGTEIGNKYPKDARELYKALEAQGLKIANCWHSTFLLTKPLEEEEQEFRKRCEFLSNMGAKVIGVSEQSYSIQGTDLAVFDNKYVMNDKEWDTLIKGLDHLGKVALEYDISLTFHHHMGTVVQNEDEVKRLMDSSKPCYVSLLYDTGHLAYCEADYLEILTKYIDRVKHIHLKDIRPDAIETVKTGQMSFLKGVRLGTFTVPGDGVIDFGPVFNIVARSNYSGWMLVEAEQDPAIANPLEYAKKAYAYIDNLMKRYNI